MSFAETQGTKRAALTSSGTALKGGMKAADLTKLLPANLQKTKYASALAGAINQKQSAWIMKGRATSDISAIRSKITNDMITKKTGVPLSSSQYAALTKTNLSFQKSATQQQISRQENVTSPLTYGTVAGVVATEQLAGVTNTYLNLLNQPPNISFPDIKFPDIKFPDLFGGLKEIGMYAIIGVVGIVAILLITRKGK